MGNRIELFRSLDESPEHRAVAVALKRANDFRNQLGHGQIFGAPDPDSSFPLADEWIIALARQKGCKELPLTAAEIETQRRNLTDALNGLARLLRALPP